MRAFNRITRAIPTWIWLTLLIALILLVGGVVSYRYWDDLAAPDESGSTTIRNIVLVLAGFIALVLALWRGAIGERQASAAERTVLDGRYQRGIEMLAGDSLSSRLGGIYSLRNLAESQPEQYHIQIMRVFCAFVRHPPPYNPEEEERDSGRAEAEASPRRHVHGRPRARADVQAVMDAIGLRSEAGIGIEKRAGFVIDLNGADLSWTYLEKADLSNADLTYANLFRAVFYEWRRGFPPPSSRFCLKLREFNPGKERPQPNNYANEKGWRRTYTAKLSGADLSYANLTRARMDHVNLSGAQIKEATLSGVWLRHANLREANLFESNLSPAGSIPMDLGADLTGADLTDASLAGSNCSMVEMGAAILHGTGFARAILWATMLNSAEFTYNGRHPPVGLTQEQLDQTIVVAGNYPDLEGVVDARTGEQLAWRETFSREVKLRRAGHSEEDENEDRGDKDGADDVEEGEDEHPTDSRN